VQLGDCYLAFREYTQAALIYHEAVHFAKDDPWLWHKLSLAYFHQGEYVEATDANKRSLMLQEFPEAQKLQADLKEKLGSGPLRGLTDRLRGRG
jgi:tetratricopeptide (TPR) repeat protein